MRDNWNELIIGDEISILNGFPFNSTFFNDEKVGLPLIRIRDLLNSSQETYYSGKYSNAFIIYDGDILVGMDGDFHIVKWKNSASLLNQRILKIEKKKNSQIDIDYLFYYLQPFLLHIHNITAATTVKHLSSYDIINARKKFPPLPQQQKIAKILSTCDEVIEKTEAAIAKYQAIKQGMMHDLFTRGIDVTTGKLRPKKEEAPHLYKESELGWIPKEWEVKQINEIGEVISGGTPSSTVDEFWNGYIVWITPSDLSKLNKVTIDNSERKITNKGLKNSSALLIKKNSLVLSSRAPIGYCAVVTTDFTTNQGCKSISFKENHNVYYHYYNLMLNINRVKLKGEGTTFAEISKKELEKIKLSFPDNVKEQEMKALRMKVIEDDIQTEQSALLKYQQIKAGLMQDLLSGKVEVEV